MPEMQSNAINRIRGPLKAVPVLIFWSSVFLFYIDFRRFIKCFGNIFPVFLPLPDTFRQKIFYLSVYGAEIILCPGGYGIIEFGG